MTSIEELSNEYSDHTVLYLPKTNPRYSQLNFAPRGNLQMFPPDKLSEPCVWASTLRTPTILKQLAAKKPELSKLGTRLLTFRDAPLSLKDKNDVIESESHNVKDELNKIGLSVKSFSMSPSKLFNPGTSANDLRNYPNNYIKSPSFVLEDINSFTNRLVAGFEVLLKDGVEIATAQEVELGESDGINFSEIHNSIFRKYNSFKCVTCNVPMSGTVCATYYRKDIYKNVSKGYGYFISVIKNKLKCFTESDSKILVVALKKISTKELFMVVNLHADYPRANNQSSWYTLKELFETVPNLLISGDFNLTLANESHFRNAFSSFKGEYSMIETPEPVEIGDPTYDFILFQS
jgi:hypothetical protein